MRSLAIYFLFYISISLDLNSTGFQIYREPTQDRLSFITFFRVSANDLIFVREDSIYKSTYRLVVEVFDEKGEVVHGEITRRRWTLQDYLKTLMRSVTDEYVFSFYVNDFTKGKIGITLSDINSSARKQYFVNLDKPVRSVGELILMKNDTVIFGDVIGIGEEVTIYGSSTYLPCSFLLKKNGFTVETYEAEQVEFQGIDIYKCSMRIPTDTGFYVISLLNDEDTSSRTLRVIDRIHTDSVRTEKLVEEMIFALPPDEFRRIRSKNIETKMTFLIDFWNGHDPTPSTERNEVMETYYRRIEYADERFVEGGKGWKTDRGKIYVLLGLPDEIEDYSFALESRPYQIWYYYSRGMKFTFVDEHLIGNYKLTEPRGWLDVWRSYFDYN